MPGLTRSLQSLIPFGLPLRTRKTIVDVYGELFCGSRFCQSGVDQPGCCDRVDVVGERERDDVGFEAVDHRARLRARAAVRLLDRDGLSGLRLPVLGEGGVEVLRRARASGRTRR